MRRSLPVFLLALALAACDTQEAPCTLGPLGAGSAAVCVTGALDLDLDLVVDQFVGAGGQVTLTLAAPDDPGANPGLTVGLQPDGPLAAGTFAIATAETIGEPGTALVLLSTGAGGPPATFTSVAGEVVVEEVAPSGGLVGRFSVTAEDRPGVVQIVGRFRAP